MAPSLGVPMVLVSGAGRRPRLFYSVLRVSERFDLWLDLNGATAGLDSSHDGLFGASTAGSDTILGQIEQVVRGGDVRRPKRRGA